MKPMLPQPTAVPGSHGTRKPTLIKLQTGLLPANVRELVPDG
jgi:hypothetical protein